MKLLADECVEKSIIKHLKDNGFEISSIAELMPGASDTSIIEFAKKERTVLLTADKDFGELIFRQGKLTHGVILIRLHGLSSMKKSRIILDILHEHQGKLVGSISVIEPTQIRISRVGI